VVRARHAWKWPVTVGVLAAVPVVAAAVLRDAGTAAILLSFPAPLAFALGFGCGRSRIVRWVAGGFVLVIVLLVGIGHAVGADRFWWGFLYAMAGGVVCLLLTLIAMGMRMAWKRSLLEFGVRSALVIGHRGLCGVRKSAGPAVDGLGILAAHGMPHLVWRCCLVSSRAASVAAAGVAAAHRQQFQFRLQFQQPEFVGRLQQRRRCVRQLVEKRALAASGAAAVLKLPVITNIEDLRVLAKKRVPRMFYDYADSGSWTESTYRANEATSRSILLRQRVAVNMENRSTRTTMVGQDVAMPVAIAPTGLTGMQHADGEILAARAAKAFGIPSRCRP
jgi:hypothetical protein